MPSFEIVPINGITQTTVEGTLDFEASATILRGVAAENAEKGKHLLIDLREAEASGLSYTDIYRLVEILGDHPVAFRGRMAILDTFRAGFEKVQFFQASATDLGFEVRAFLDEGAAVVWLEAGEPEA
jgi:hypothetical protein